MLESHVTRGRETQQEKSYLRGRAPEEGLPVSKGRPVDLNCPCGSTYEWTSRLPLLILVQHAALVQQRARRLVWTLPPHELGPNLGLNENHYSANSSSHLDIYSGSILKLFYFVLAATWSL